MTLNTYESQTTISAGLSFANENVRYAQNWTPSLSYEVSQIQLWMSKGSETGDSSDLAIDIYLADSNHHPTGSSLGQATINAGEIGTTAAWETGAFSSVIPIIRDIEYCFVVKITGSDVIPMLAATANSSDDYDGGYYFKSTDGGTNWTDYTTWDMTFKIQGNPSVEAVDSDSYLTKRLVSLSSGEVWLETAGGGTMERLTDSVGEIDTTDFLNSFELYGKGFIVNRSIKKVIDLVNTKITTADLGANPPDFGTVLTGGTSEAAMIVDYITSLTDDAACIIYGKRTTTATFTNGETVTGIDDDENAISFVLSADEDAPPHFYDWTVYGNNTTLFGTIPDNATLGCNYRGRAVISGDPLHPHQWYMSRQFNPWNFLYGQNDPLSAVAGNNTDAGEVGDIVLALIPYGDDFLIFGCANSMWILDGDPCIGGTIDLIDNSVGIYGSRAWCKDSQGNLYFYGTGGFYKMGGGREKPINISLGPLPNLINDWAATPATHRVVVSYDSKNEGVLISRTTLATGANLNYWYDFRLQGFYPEDYPNACGIFSSFNYAAVGATTKKLIFGCNDGYLRGFTTSSKDDDNGASDTAISSYVTLPIIKMSEEDDKEGKLSWLVFELAGGASGGDFSDTDGVTYEVFVGNDAETVLEDIRDGATAFAVGTLSGTGRKNKIRIKARGRWLGIKLYNSTASETWAINTLSGKIIPAGRIK